MYTMIHQLPTAPIAATFSVHSFSPSDTNYLHVPDSTPNIDAPGDLGAITLQEQMSRNVCQGNIRQETWERGVPPLQRRECP